MMTFIPKLIIASLLATFLFSCSEPPDTPALQDTITTEEQPVLVEYLFVQHADSVTLQDGVLTLEGIGETVLFFSDRPHRIVGRETIQQFLESWDEGDDPFLQTPPNAVLTIKRDNELRDMTAILRDPVLTGQTLAYAVEVLNGPTSGSGSSAALFIDAFGLEMGRPGKKRSGKPGGESRFGKPGRPGDGGQGGDRELGDPGGLGDGMRGGESGVDSLGRLGRGARDIGRQASDVPREILHDIL
jgi:hypothetical protein